MALLTKYTRRFLTKISVSTAGILIRILKLKTQAADYTPIRCIKAGTFKDASVSNISTFFSGTTTHFIERQFI